MKRINTLWYALAYALVLALFSNNLFAQTYQWANGAASEGREYGNYITTDDSGNVYVSGQFEFDCDFGSKTISTSGQHDIFIAKYNAAGTLKWVKKAGGTDGDAGHGIGIDADRNIYTSGEFETTCYFTPNDSITVGGTGINNIYIAKHDNNGNLIWVKSVVSNGDCRGRALVTDAAGNSYFTGSLSRTCQFGSITVNYTGSSDSFLAKYDSTGNAVWVKKQAGTKDDKGKGVALDPSGNVLVCATFTQNISISGNGLTAVGLYDSFICKYNNAGVYQWHVQAGGTDTTKMSAIATDIDGNSYVTGYFIDTATFGTTTLYSLGSYEFFIAKYDANGNFVWAKRGGGANEDFGQGISYDSRRNVLYVTGQFDYMANFDGTPVVSNGNRDVFVSCWDTSGNMQWINTGGSVNRDAGFAVANDTSGNVFATGFIDQSAVFGSFNIAGDSLADVFVAKISPPGATQPTVASTNISSSISNCTDINLSWTNGNGASRLVVAKAGTAVSAFPLDANSYTADAIFGDGSYLGSGSYVVYAGNGNSCTVTGLNAGTTYHFAVIEFNGTGITTNYNTTTYPVTNVLANSFSVSVSASPAAICAGSSSTLTASGGVSYTWSPSTGLSATTGSSVTATLNSSITYTVTASDGNGCNATTTIPVTVNALPTVTLGNFTDACVTSTSETLTGGSPAGGTYSGPFVNAGTFNPSGAGAGQHIITYSYTNGNGCSNSTTATINVNSLPAVTVSTQASVCVNASPVLLTGGTPAGGTYSGTGVSSGSFSAAIAGQGTFVITYSYTDGFGCANSDTATITVNLLPVVSLASFNAVCQNAASFALTGGIPASGTYSGTGVIGGSFFPNVAGSGQHTITYSYTDGNGCANTATNTITVNALPVVTLGSFNAMCLNAAALTLTGGSPAGGTYSGSGVSNGVFTPSSLGSNNIIYNYTDVNGCASFATSSIMVNALPVVTIAPFNPVCINSGSFVLTGGNPAGGTWTGGNVSAGSFNPVMTGNNSVIYNYTDGNGCSNFASGSIMVNSLPVISLGQDTTICMYHNIMLDAGAGFASYLWSGGATTQTILIDTTGTGIGTATFTITVTNAASCTASDNINITFDICAGMDEGNQQPPLGIVFPNPFSGQITVFTDARERGILVTFSDVLGNIIFSKTLTSASETIQPDVAAGVYFLRIEKGRTITTIKVVKTN
jgi:hypothetical protein